MRKRILIISFLTPIIVSLATFYLWMNLNVKVKEEAVSTPKIEQITLEKVEKNVLAGYPDEFWDLTIPYLRNKKFEASEIKIIETLYERSNYTAYRASYKSDNLDIYGLLTIPKDQTKRYPAVVFNHGYIAPSVYKTDEKYVEYIDYLARNEIVVFKIDFRGHDQSEGKAYGAYYDSGYVVDALYAYEALRLHKNVQPTKVAMWGHSMSGNVTLRAIAVNPNIPAGIIWGGAVYTYKDLTDYGIDDNSYRPQDRPSDATTRRQRLFDSVGAFSQSSEFWKLVVPTNFIEGYKGQIDLHHAVDDNVVSIEYSRNLHEILEGEKIESNLYEYSSGGHNITSPAFSQAMQRTVSLIKEL